MNKSDLNTEDLDLLVTENVTKYGESEVKTDEEMLQKIKSRESEVQDFYGEMVKRYAENRKYWKGDQVDVKKLFKGQRKNVVNRVFMGIETIIPIVTARDPEADIRVYPYSGSNIALQEKLSRYFNDQWEITNKMRQQSQKSVRNHIMAGYTFIKVYYDTVEKCNKYKLIPPQNIKFPRKAVSIDDAPYIIELVESNLGEVYKKFPEKSEEFKKYLGGIGEDIAPESPIVYSEYWENTLVCWKYKDFYFGSHPNPTYNFTDNRKNHFKYPRKPYVTTDYLSTGDSIHDPITLVEEVMTLQDNVNNRKGVIEINAKFANGIWVGAGKQIKREDFMKIDYDTDKIFAEDAEVAEGAIAQFMGRTMEPGMFEDMQDSKKEMDDIMGTHASTRGQMISQTTATGLAITKESDHGRIELFGANIIDQVKEDLCNWDLQLIKVNFKEQYPIHTLPEGNDPTRMSAKDKKLYISSEEFDNVTVKIFVRTGNASKDSLTKANEAVDLATRGLMWVGDMFKALGYSNYRELAKNAFLAENAPEKLYPELTNPEGFDSEAIRHIDSILESEDEFGEIFIFDSTDPQEYQRHVQTHIDYLSGIEVDEDLLPVSELDQETLDKIKEHVEAEKAQLESMLETIEPTPEQLLQEAQMGSEPELPVESELPLEEEVAPVQGLV